MRKKIEIVCEAYPFVGVCTSRARGDHQSLRLRSCMVETLGDRNFRRRGRVVDSAFAKRTFLRRLGLLFACFKMDLNDFMFYTRKQNF